MKVESICSHDIVSVDAGQTLRHAAQLMREHHVGALVVTDMRDGEAQVRGIVTDRDIVVEVLALGGDTTQTTVSGLVQGPPRSIGADADLAQAVQAMQAAGTRRLLVHDGQGQLVGILSFDDLLPALVAPLAGLVDVLRLGMQRETQARGPVAAKPRPTLRVPAMGTAGWQARTGI